jgi:nicotinic acid mononucleotide adenylyltransferase
MLKEQSELRFNKDIGLFCIDRGRQSCKHATAYCKENCYNRKLYKVFKNMVNKDIRSDKWWQSLTGKKVAKSLNRRKLPTDRIRFMTRGEAISDASDIDRVEEIVTYNSNRLFKMPTRAWRNKTLRRAIEKRLSVLSNLYVMASIDPSNTKDEIQYLLDQNWSTMFFGNDKESPTGNEYKCPKTWKHLKGHCAECKSGCFSDKQVHVWLKQH